MSYLSEISKIQNVTIEDVIRISKQYVPSDYYNKPWSHPDLNHGKNLLHSEDALCCYMAAYGEMHWHKLKEALRTFPFDKLTDEFELYDWGCGQGIGSFAFVQALRTYKKDHLLKTIHLEDPSPEVTARARMNLNALGCKKIITSNAYLPSQNLNTNTISALELESPVAVHIFSNVLDIDQISLKGVADLLLSPICKQYVLCIGPANLQESRIEEFVRYFKDFNLQIIKNFRDVNFGVLANKKQYGCNLKLFQFSQMQPFSSTNYYAPIQYFAAYSESNFSCNNEYAAFEIVAPFDLTSRTNLHPVYALISNLISRGMPTRASRYVKNQLNELNISDKEKALKIVAQIQKSLVEVIISGQLNTTQEAWKILVLEKDTDVAQIAIKDFVILYEHLTSLSVDYDTMHLPSIIISSSKNASKNIEYDLIIDFANKETYVRTYKAHNDCYIFVSQSSEIFASRYIYTTERIKYKPIAYPDLKGGYIIDEVLATHARYFLQWFFDKEDFRPGQLPILSRALQLKSVIGLLPTGGGKSLTYQLAALLQPAITIVIDPLRSLMKDQYDGLIRSGVDVCTYINSDLDEKEKQAAETKITSSQTQFIFLSPERLSIYRFRQTLQAMQSSHIYFAYGVIDEVHCVSEWGHDFRLAYLHLGRNLYNYVLAKPTNTTDEHISLFGLTATASFDVLADVERELSGNYSYRLENDATVRYENTNRLELQYNVLEIDSTQLRSIDDVKNAKLEHLPSIIKNVTDKFNEIQSNNAIDYIKRRFVERENLSYTENIRSFNIGIDVDSNWYNYKHSNAACIIFAPHKEGNIGVSGIAEYLNNNGFQKISTFKGGDSVSQQDDFIRGGSHIMVATKAFGMGIDKPNVRFTFHMNYPSSLESFVQEAGRAGRDRKMALATIIYSSKKFSHQNVRTRLMEQFSTDYIINKYFYDKNFLGENFELFVIQMLLSTLQIEISNEEFDNTKTKHAPSQGLLNYLRKFPKGKKLVFYIPYKDDLKLLDFYNQQLIVNRLPILKPIDDNANINSKYGFGSTKYKDAIQKAIYRMCVIGLIDDFTEDYNHQTFRVVATCHTDDTYFANLKSYYLKYFSEDRANSLMSGIEQLDADPIMAALKHLTKFIYGSIAQKRARGILDMEQFCNTAISSKSNWLETNEELKDFIYYYFNSKYAREGYIANNGKPFSLTDDTDRGKNGSFEWVRKYMGVVSPEILGNESEKDNIKHLQGAIRLIRRAIPEPNPALDFLNVFCILFLHQTDNELLKEEMIQNFIEGYSIYKEMYGDSFDKLLEQYKVLLIQYHALDDNQSQEYMGDLISLAQLSLYNSWLNNFKKTYIQ